MQLNMTGWKPQYAAIFSQLQRSSLSIQLNIAEGYAFGDSPTLRKHLRIAYGSAVESEDLLYLMNSLGQFDQTALTNALQLCDETQKLLFGLMKKYRALAQHQKQREGSATRPDPQFD